MLANHTPNMTVGYRCAHHCLVLKWLAGFKYRKNYNEKIYSLV